MTKRTNAGAARRLDIPTDLRLSYVPAFTATPAELQEIASAARAQALEMLHDEYTADDLAAAAWLHEAIGACGALRAVLAGQVDGPAR